MSAHWRALCVLFLVRVTMALQFQSVAALSPFMMTNFGVGLADIGLLIGLYVSPGVIIALPGGAIGKRFGDKQAVAFGLVLMLAGGLLIALVPHWEAQIAGRVLAGIGGVILNVLMTKMLTDWFAGREIATAMAIFVNSWPLGIAIGLAALPPIAEAFGVPATMGVIAAAIALGLCLLIFGYQPATSTVAAGLSPTDSVSNPTTGLRGVALAAIIVAGSIWGAYNAALSMIFSFGPALLVERGWSAAAASASTSIVLWIFPISGLLGGFLADRLQRRELVLVVSFTAFAALMFAIPSQENFVPIFIALGLCGGLAAGPIMSLPATVLRPETRAIGLGVYFTLFYIFTMLAPFAAGSIAEALGTAEATFTMGGTLLVACLALLATFKVLQRRVPAA